MFSAAHSISLLFNANKVFDRQVIEGIGHYLQSTQVDWDVYLEEDFLCRLEHIHEWGGNGIIADFDDPQIREALKDIKIPVVGVGSSYADESLYPEVPYVATDNEAIVKAAYDHLKQKGMERFAFYGLPVDEGHLWAHEREQAMLNLCKQDSRECALYRGQPTSAETWQYNMNRLADWLDSLPTPIGIVAVTDARARHLLQACANINRLVPDHICVVGIDDDDIARNLSRISLSSVTQGCFDMGFQAAKLLHKRMENPNLKDKRVLIPPVGVVERQSSDFKSIQDPYVMQAMHYIRQHACRGIKVGQVLDHIGISRSNLENRFMEERGHSVHAAIHQEKLNRACELLSNSNKPVKEIALVCGYRSLQYLYAVFNQHFGITPSEYRNRNRLKASA
uniref:XylR family transcriptional regulator n=1 Tax=Ningiella ruwaisensis TaxID=2364274 RepID=UPI00109FEEBA|nr:DNA-binding transcriptional regulator [Ningiella ruwaisensis]